MDPVDLHLLGYGFPGLPPDDLIYRTALPRLVALFAEVDMPATFFMVGRDAAAHVPALRALEAAGHEVASHTMNHPMAFASLAPERVRTELAESRAALMAASGAEVVGFRAPNWDTHPRIACALAETGYRYDASSFPSPWLAPGRLLLALKARDARAVLKMGLLPSSMRRKEHDWPAGSRTVRQFPISVTPRFKFPIYHTVRYLMGDRRFHSQLDGFVKRGEPFYYTLHAVDALGSEEDQVDPRMSTHPGMQRSLKFKTDLLRRSLAAIRERFAPTTYRALVDKPL